MSVAQALTELSGILQREKTAGRQQIGIAPESIDLLRNLASAPPAPVAEPAPVTKAEPVAKIEAPAPADTPPPAAVSTLAELTAPDLITVEGETKRDRLNNLFRALKADKLTQLPTLRKQLVFAKGNPDAAVMFVGEGPGYEEENQKRPFVGPSGQLLDKIIGAMGLNPAEDIYVSNIVKYRPQMGDGTFQGQKNRKPTPDEMSAMVAYVLTEINIVRPQAIVALGSSAAEGLLGLVGSLGKMRNQFYNVADIPTMVTYHPSYLLRSESNSPNRGKSEKRKVWEDLLLVMEKVGLPISEKQQRYFL